METAKFNHILQSIERLKYELKSDGRNTSWPLLIAEAKDVMEASISGTNMREAYLSELDSFLWESDGEFDRNKLIKLLEAAEDEARSQAERELAAPDNSQHLQDAVFMALFKSKPFKRSLAGIVFLYLLGAAALLGTSFRVLSLSVDVANAREEIMKNVEDAKKHVKDSKDAVENGKSELQQTLGKIRSFDEQVEAKLREFDAAAEDFSAKMTLRFDATISTIEGKPAEADAKIEQAFLEASSIAGNRIKEIERDTADLKNRYDEFGRAADLHDQQIAGMDETIQNKRIELDRVLKTAGELADSLPGRMDALLEDKKPEIDAKIALFLEDETNRQTSEFITELEALRNEFVDIRDAQIAALGRDIAARELVLDNIKDRSESLRDELGSRTADVRARLSDAQARNLDIEVAVEALDRRRAEVEAILTGAEGVAGRLTTSEDRLAALLAGIEPAKAFVQTLNDRSGTVAELLADAMVTSNTEIADAIWLKLSSDYVHLALAVLVIILLAWLVAMTFWLRRFNRSTFSEQAGA